MKAAGLMQSVTRHSSAMRSHYSCSLSPAAAPLLSGSRVCVCSPSLAVPRSSTRVYAGWYDGEGDNRQTDREDGSDRPSSYRDRGSSRRGDSSSYGRGRGSRGGRGGSSRGNRDESTDWACPECGYSNFARNTSCRSCEAPRPEGVGGAARSRGSDRGDRYEDRQSRYQDGDWECSSCGAHNFARRTTCFKCGEPGGEGEGGVSSGPPQRGYDRGYDRPYEGRSRGDGDWEARPRRGAASEEGEKRPGEWDCPSCGAMNFARRIACYKCAEPAPAEVLAAQAQQQQQAGSAPRERRDGDWDCPECGELNFERRTSCRKCGTAAPGGGGQGASRERREYGGRQMREPREYVAKEGDWTCGECGNINYAFRTECKKCRAPKA